MAALSRQRRSRASSLCASCDGSGNVILPRTWDAYTLPGGGVTWLFNEQSDPDREELLRLLGEVGIALEWHGINVPLPPAS